MNEQALDRVGQQRQIKKNFPLSYTEKSRQKANQRPGIPGISLTSRRRCLHQSMILAFYVNWNFITAFTKVAHWIPSCGRENRAQSLTLLPLLRLILTISSHTKSVITNILSHMHTNFPPISSQFFSLDLGYLMINICTSWYSRAMDVNYLKNGLYQHYTQSFSLFIPENPVWLRYKDRPLNAF